jgi:hypothetical protein
MGEHHSTSKPPVGCVNCDRAFELRVRVLLGYRPHALTAALEAALRAAQTRLSDPVPLHPTARTPRRSDAAKDPSVMQRTLRYGYGRRDLTQDKSGEQQLMRRCCIAPGQGRFSAVSTWVQIAMANPSNATANRRLAISSAASS